MVIEGSSPIVSIETEEPCCRIMVARKSINSPSIVPALYQIPTIPTVPVLFVIVGFPEAEIVICAE